MGRKTTVTCDRCGLEHTYDPDIDPTNNKLPLRKFFVDDMVELAGYICESCNDKIKKGINEFLFGLMEPDTTSNASDVYNEQPKQSDPYPKDKVIQWPPFNNDNNTVMQVKVEVGMLIYSTRQDSGRLSPQTFWSEEEYVGNILMLSTGWHIFDANLELVPIAGHLVSYLDDGNDGHTVKIEKA